MYAALHGGGNLRAPAFELDTAHLLQAIEMRLAGRKPARNGAARHAALHGGGNLRTLAFELDAAHLLQAIEVRLAGLKPARSGAARFRARALVPPE